MTYQLEPGRHRVAELAETYSADEADDLADVESIDLLAVALVEMATLQGDDFAKRSAMRHLIAVLARLDREAGAETVIELDDLAVTIHRSADE